MMQTTARVSENFLIFTEKNDIEDGANLGIVKIGEYVLKSVKIRILPV